MRYQVRFVEDGSLPSDVEFVFVRLAGRTHLFIKGSTIDSTTGLCDALTRAWSVWESAELQQHAGVA